MKDLNLSFDKIKCPRHNTELRLFIDEGNSPNSIIAWYCERCKGYWYEDFFYFENNKGKKPKALDYNFFIKCPKCGSFKVFHHCEPICCSQHGCSDCGAGFEIEADILHRGDSSLKLHNLRGYHLNEGKAVGVGYFKMFEDYQKIEFGSKLRKCVVHPNAKIILCIQNSCSNDTRIGWYCKECNTINFEYGFINKPKFFSSIGNPGYACNICGSLSIDSVDEGTGKCINCNSTFKFIFYE
ncbi:MAG: hypothetical protein HY911_05125 [Desulfobacterales bacterium]|nr:hypothetical protein [Desulfobacterales bacterium]